MILLGGIASESPLAMVREQLDQLGADYAFFNQRAVAECRISLQIDDHGVAGRLSLEGRDIELASLRATYLRLMDDRLLPEIEALPSGDSLRRRSRGFHDALLRWQDVAPGRIVNRSEAQGSNGSKPYQAQLIARHGLLAPPTLITSDPEAVIAFRDEHGAVIYKSISAVRSIVRRLRDDDLKRLDRIGWCPVQFQALIPGVDVRVHVVGAVTLATEIVSDQIDYRYARREGGAVELRAMNIPEDISRACIGLTASLGLSFSGIDLKRTASGEWYCFEVNPSPAFSYFEVNSGQPIAATLARYLAFAEEALPEPSVG